MKRIYRNYHEKLLVVLSQFFYFTSKPLPGSFALHDLDGNLWTEQSLKGHKVVINAWFSGCGPCLREMPILSEWKKKYPDVIFLSVNFEKADPSFHRPWRGWLDTLYGEWHQ